MSQPVPSVPSGLARRRRSRAALPRSSTMGVHTGPGAIALTRIPFGPSWTATERTNPITPALAVAYAVRPYPRSPAIDDTQITAPPPRRAIAGTAACVARNIDLRSTAMTRSHSSSVVSSRPLRDSMPTLLCRMSTPPQRSTAAFTIAAHSAARVTSAACATASPRSARIAATVSSARSFIWSTQKTLAPSRAKRMAVALPLPRPGPREPAPVTIAILPFRRPLTGRSPRGPRAGIAVPRQAAPVGAEAGRHQRLEDGAAAHGAAVPGRDLQTAHRPLQDRTLHQRLEGSDGAGQIHVLPAGQRRELAAVPFGQEPRPALAEDEPVLRQPRRRDLRAVEP